MAYRENSLGQPEQKTIITGLSNELWMVLKVQSTRLTKTRLDYVNPMVKEAETKTMEELETGSDGARKARPNKKQQRLGLVSAYLSVERRRIPRIL